MPDFFLAVLSEMVMMQHSLVAHDLKSLILFGIIWSKDQAFELMSVKMRRGDELFV